MFFMDRLEENYQILKDFKASCNDENVVKLIDIFTPMLYKVNTNQLEISIGKQVKSSVYDKVFRCYLSSFSCNFVVMLDTYKDKPRFIIKDKTSRAGTIIVVIDLDGIRNLHIKIVGNSYYMSFTCTNGFDIVLHLKGVKVTI